MTEKQPESPDDEASARTTEPASTRISRESPAARHAAAVASTAMSRDLRTIHEKEGAEAALGHASGAVLAATMFIAFDIGHPDVARSTVDYWAKRLAGTMPEKPDGSAEPSTFNKGPKAVAAKWADDATAWLWDAHRQFDPAFSKALAEATVRAGLRFLVETYRDDHARELAEDLRSEVDQMVTDRNATIAAPRQ